MDGRNWVDFLEKERERVLDGEGDGGLERKLPKHAGSNA